MEKVYKLLWATGEDMMIGKRNFMVYPYKAVRNGVKYMSVYGRLFSVVPSMAAIVDDRDEYGKILVCRTE